MGYIDPIKQKEYVKRHYEENKEFYLARLKKRKTLFARIVSELKLSPCMDCGIVYPPYVMDFDHVRGVKVRNVSNYGGFSSPTKLLEEIDKCDLVCSNCHRIRTHDGRRSE